MKHSYKTKGTCSSRITFELDGNIVRNIEFTGGCNGNLSAISRLLEGASVEEIVKKCSGIACGSRATSCSDQLSAAVVKAYEEENGTN